MKTRPKISTPAKKLRARAERLLGTTRQEVAEMSAEEVQKLVHELQVHQIELKMQNDELRQTQMELESARERLSLPYDAAPVGFLELDDKGIIHETNLAAARLLNVPRVKLTGEKLTRFIAPESRDAFFLHRRGVFSTGATQTCELQMLPPEGQRFEARLETIMERTGPDRSNRCLMILTDITERKQAEESLRNSQQQLKLILQDANIGLWNWNLKNDRVDYSREWKTQLGYADNEIGDPLDEWLKRLHPDDLGPVLKKHRQFIKHPWPDFEVEFRLRHKDGSWHWILSRATLQRDADGKAARMMGIHVDITARKQSEEALRQARDEMERRVQERTGELTAANTALRAEIAERKQAEEALLKSEERFRAIAAHTPDHIIIQDLHLRYRLVINPQLGLTEADMLGKTDRALFKKADAERLTAIKKKVLATGKPFHLETSLPNLQGEIEVFEGDYIPKLDTTGKAVGLIGYFHNITARKQAEEAQRREKEFADGIITTVQTIILILDTRGRIVRFNPYMEQLSGYRLEEVRGKNWFKIFLPDANGKHLRKLFLKALTGSPTQGNINAIRIKDGTLRQIEWNDTPLKDALGRITGLVAFGHDITERKQAEEALKAREAQLHSFVEQAPAAIAMFDRNMNYLATSARWKSDFHPTTSQLIGRNHYEINPNLPDHWKEAHRKGLAGESQSCEDDLWLQADGTKVWLSWSVNPWLDAGGKIGGIMVLAENITPRKEAEAALRASEERLAYALEAGTDGLWDWNIPAGEVYYSPGWLLGLGYEPGKVPPSMEFWKSLIHPDDAKHVTEKLQVHLAGGSSVYECECRLRKKSGEYEWHLDRGRVVKRDRDGAPLRMVGIDANITERKQAEEALRKSEARLQAIMDNSPAMIFLKDTKGRYLHFNRRLAEAFHLSLEKSAGKTEAELYPPAQAAICRANDRKMLKAGVPMDFEEVTIQDDGQHTNLVTKFPLRDADGEIYAIGGIVNDITERKRTEARIVQLNRVQAILADIDRAIVRTPDRQKLLDEVCRIAVQKGGFKLAWIGMASSDGSVQPVATAGTTGYIEGFRVVTHDVPEGRGPVGTAIRENRTVVIEDISRDARMTLWRARARRFRLNYAAAFPIRISGKVTGAFTVYAPQAGFFDENELNLLTQVSDEISYALTAIADVAARQQAEEALRRSEYNLSIFFNQAPIGLVWLSAGGTILRANLAQLDLLGYSAKNYLGQSFLQFCGDATQGLDLLQRLAAKETIRNFPMTRRRRDGTIRHVLVDANSFWSDNQFQYSSIFLRDITERIELERGILQVSEREHRHIAQDLHDGLGQLLAGTAYLTGTLRQKLAAQSLPEARQAGRILEVINEAIAQTRSLARGLHPVEPEPNGLMVALQALAGRTKKLFHVRCRFTCPEPVLIQDNAVATHLFRIAQEAITNAIRHGKPERIEISLTETPDWITLAIKDNGAGMPSRRRKKTGMGLRIMRYRAGMIGGSLAIQKEAGNGTTVICTVHSSSSEGHSGKKNEKD